jgi:hypothetical protein
MYYGDMLVYPRLRVSGFATRSATEVVQVQQSFATMAQSNFYTDRELMEIAERMEVVFDGRGKEGDEGDSQTNPLDDETGTSATPDAQAEPGETTELSPDAIEGASDNPAPLPARKTSAIGLRRKQKADPEETGQASIAESTLVNKIAGGKPLSERDLRAIDAYFETAGDVQSNSDWATEGPSWQEWNAYGGQAMIDYLRQIEADAQADLTPENTELETEPETTDETESETRAVSETRAPQKYEHIDFSPPQGVRNAAKRGLEVRASKPPSERGGTEVGVARARDLSNGREVSPDTARRMKAYFDRHVKDKQGKTWDEQGKGWQAWHLWGGDPGQSWSEKLVKQMNAADEDAKSRTIPGFGRTGRERYCGECAPTTRARKQLFSVPTRTGTYMTWRALTPVEQAVSFDHIATQKSAAVARMTSAIEAQQRAHRSAFSAAAQPAIDQRRFNDIANMSIDWRDKYRQAMLPSLRERADFAAGDTLEEIAAQSGSTTWVAASDVVLGSAAQVEAAATMAAASVNDRMNEQLRGAAVQVANGARPATLKSAPVSIGNTAAGLLEQTASTTVNETRAVTAAEQGPRIRKAVYSAVMDRMTCDVCAEADGTEVEYGSERYRRMSPPNPRCKSVANSGGSRNLCQCVWVYEYETDSRPPGPINTTPSGGLVVRSRPLPENANELARLNLVCGLPGTGKSTWAVEQGGIVIDRDMYVLDDEGNYDSAGRAESMRELTEAVRNAGPGQTVHYVALMLGRTAREKIANLVQSEVDPASFYVTITALEADLDEVRRVNEARANTERKSIPADQLEHLIDAWDPPTEDEGIVEYVWRD